MKKSFMTVAASILSLSLLCGFTYGSEQPTQEANTAPVMIAQRPGAGMMRVKSPKDFQKYGVFMTAPQGAIINECNMVNGAVCEIKFSYAGVKYSYKSCSNPKERLVDFTKVVGRPSKYSAPSKSGKAVNVIQQNHELKEIDATWGDAKMRYNLSTMDKTDPRGFTAIVRQIISKDMK